jgi:hypothetical protein
MRDELCNANAEGKGSTQGEDVASGILRRLRCHLRHGRRFDTKGRDSLEEERRRSHTKG